MSVWDKKLWLRFEDKAALLVILPWDVLIPDVFCTILLQLSPLPVVPKELFMWLCSELQQELAEVENHEQNGL